MLTQYRGVWVQIWVRVNARHLDPLPRMQEWLGRLDEHYSAIVGKFAEQSPTLDNGWEQFQDHSHRNDHNCGSHPDRV